MKPEIMRSRVDFPQPDGPSRATNSPPATSRIDVTHREKSIQAFPYPFKSEAVTSKDSYRLFSFETREALALPAPRTARDSGVRHRQCRYSIVTTSKNGGSFFFVRLREKKGRHGIPADIC